MDSANPAMNQTKADRLVDVDATSDQRTYALLMHMSLLANLVTGGLGIVVALVMWLIKKGDSPFIDDHGREAINFQITMIGYIVVALALGFIICVFWLLIPVIQVLGLVGMILAAIAANRGEYFRYPATIRLIH